MDKVLNEINLVQRMIIITVSITNLFIGIGIIGNVLSFLVFSRKAFAKSSINIYCRALAIFDSFIVVYLILTILTWYVNTFSTQKYTISCRIMYFFNTTFSPISGWILVAFGIDQAICVSNTQRFQYTKKLSFQIGLIIFLAIFHIGAYIGLPIQLEVKNITIVVYGFNVTLQSCALGNIPNVKPYLTTYLIESNIVPFVIMILTTVYIVRVLRNSTKRVVSQLNVANSKSMKSARQKKYALSSVVLSILFILLTAPTAAVLIFPSGDFVYDSFTFRIMSIFFNINYSCHFFSHFIVNSIFRNEFLNMIRFRSERNRFASISQFTAKA